MSILHEYMEIMADPAHGLAECTFTLVVDGILLGLVWPAVRKAIRREHKLIDAEYGVEHEKGMK
jgi:hypothetical protein